MVFAIEISGSTKNFILLVIVLFRIGKIIEIRETRHKNSPALALKSGTMNEVFTNQAAATVFLLIPKTQPTAAPVMANKTADPATSAATPFRELITVDVAYMIKS